VSTEKIDPEFVDLDLWPTGDAVLAMAEGQAAAVAAVRAQAEAIAVAAEAAADRLRGGSGRLIYCGAGTSARIAVQDGVELVPTFGWDETRLVYAVAGGMSALLTSVEGAEDDEAAGEAAVREARAGPQDIVIAIAASGSTAYTVAALQAGGEAGALTIGIANNPGTALLEAAAHPILLETGAEIVAGSTRMKAGTAQKIALNLFSTALMIRLGHVYRGLMVDMRPTNRKLRERAIFMVGEIAGVDRPAAQAALEQAGGGIKLAALIAMGAEPQAGEAVLRDAGGDLRAAILIWGGSAG
jgi:N-acetylmuramic acid 6-phosphate etherase